MCYLRDFLGAQSSWSISVEVVPESCRVDLLLLCVVRTRTRALIRQKNREDFLFLFSIHTVLCVYVLYQFLFHTNKLINWLILSIMTSILLTSGFLGENLTVVPVLGVNFFSELGEAMGSFLGEIFIFVGEISVLLFGPSSLSSSFFFIMASLELALTEAGFFLGDGLITSSDMLPLRSVFDELLVLPAAESVLLFWGNAAGFSSEPLRAWTRTHAQNYI